jgi:hypothetical protein
LPVWERCRSFPAFRSHLVNISVNMPIPGINER